MGQLYVAFHAMVGPENIREVARHDTPGGTINHNVCVVITCMIVGAVVETAFAQYRDDESEEKTPPEHADRECDRLMNMPPEQWCDEIIIFSPSDVVANQRLFDELPGEHPPFP
uniref:Uncharacterized protein n=1 Tax=Haptolina brevifila TaxID=156173 RepID=A0A7S2FL77_9EUKA|mmetsp:Transcript_14362/g.28848  ORF Transcript_14362/g.28848 Transcript_14362/m.28848 type:complete len:114 (+) Transcript_14362:119-460(+)